MIKLALKTKLFISIIVIFAFLSNLSAISISKYEYEIVCFSSLWWNKILAGDEFIFKTRLFVDGQIIKEKNIICWIRLQDGFILNNDQLIPPDEEGWFKYEIKAPKEKKEANIEFLFYKNNKYLTGYSINLKTYEGIEVFHRYQTMASLGSITTVLGGLLKFIMMVGMMGGGRDISEGEINTANYLFYGGALLGISGMIGHFAKVASIPSSFDEDENGRIMANELTFEATTQ